MHPRRSLSTKIAASLAGMLAAAGLALTGCADDGAATREGGSSGSGASGSGSGTGSASGSGSAPK